MNSLRKPVLWYQGLFLQPQHLQQFDIGLQEQLAAQRTYLQPHCWGLAKLRINPNALQERVIEIHSFEGMFADGTRVVAPGNCRIVSRSCKNIPLDALEKEPFTVYLGLRRWKPGEANVAGSRQDTELQDLDYRYLGDRNPAETPDWYLNGPPAQIRYLEHLVKIFWSTEVNNLGDYSLLPILQLRLEGNELRIAQEYIPPILAQSASEELLQLLKDLGEQLLSRVRVFETYKLSGGIQSPDFEAHFLPHLLVLGALNRFLPELAHITETPATHPFDIYGVLRRLIGELSTFSERINALGQLKDGRCLLPGYDHLNLTACFHAAHQLIEELLNDILISGGNFIQLLREQGMFAANIPAEDFDQRNIFTLVVTSQQDPQRTVKSFQEMSKIGGPEEIETLVSRALPGVPFRHRLAPPPGIPKKNNASYFKLDHSHQQWLGIRNARAISLFWDDAPEDAVVELVITRT